MVRRLAAGIVLCGWLCLSFGCSQTVRIAVDQEPSPGLFGHYHSYFWLPPLPQQLSDPRVNSELVQWRIQAAVDSELSLRGWAKSERDAAQVLVQSNFSVRERTTDTFEDYYWYKRTGGSGGPQEAYVFGYEEGSLTIELLDAATSQRLWRATVSAVLGKGHDPQRLLTGVPKLFEQMPD